MTQTQKRMSTTARSNGMKITTIKAFGPLNWTLFEKQSLYILRLFQHLGRPDPKVTLAAIPQLEIMYHPPSWQLEGRRHPVDNLWQRWLIRRVPTWDITLGQSTRLLGPYNRCRGRRCTSSFRYLLHSYTYPPQTHRRGKTGSHRNVKQLQHQWHWGSGQR